jgi:hypothetical protein
MRTFICTCALLAALSTSLLACHGGVAKWPPYEERSNPPGCRNGNPC